MKEAAAFPEKRSDVYPEKSSVENRRDEQGCRKKRWNRRKTTIVFLIVAIGFLTAVCIGGFFCKEVAQVTDFSRKNLPPCLSYPFGTDWLGRDMFARTVRGLSIKHYYRNLCCYIQCSYGIYPGSCFSNNGKNSRRCCDLVY